MVAFITCLYLLQSFVLEVQRMWPVVPLGVPHGTTEETILEEKWRLPKGCMVVPLHWYINRYEDS